MPSPLTLRDVIPYLLNAKHLTLAQVVDGDLTVRAHRRRNRSFSIRWNARAKNVAGVFLKQLTSSGEAGRSEFLVYALAKAHPHAALRTLPRVLHLDRDRDIIAIELIEPDVPIWNLVEDAQAASIALFDRLGATLAELHGLFREWHTPPGFETSPWRDVVPWAFHAREPPIDILGELSAANACLLRILSEGVDASLFAAARTAWRPSTVVHHDFKMDNVLSPATAGLPRIVDWEFAGWGDPAWDVATMLQSILSIWIANEARDDGAAASALVLPAVQARCAAFWSGYAATSALDAADKQSLRWRAVLLSALRLLQSAYESGHRAPRLGKFAVLATQVAANIGADPARAASTLYELP